MAIKPQLSFSNLKLPTTGTIIALCWPDAGLPAILDELPDVERAKQAAKISEFEAKARSSVNIVAPGGKVERLILLGCGADDDEATDHWLKLGGKAFTLAGKASRVTVVVDAPEGNTPSAQDFANFALGIKLSAYKFDTYKTKTGTSGKKADKDSLKITIACNGSAAAKQIWSREEGVGDGVLFARQLVNEPANILGTEEFARQLKNLSELGVKVTILEEKNLRAKKMNALLGVSRGSVQPPKLVVMEYSGGKPKDKPYAFVGKGVVFDTGGISLKPPTSMEDMKGDMGGAAAVAGLMHALAARKAKANIVGIIGLVENMPDANAQRPGDIVTSMSGQTIEIINTDAEGRLVLADALWYCQEEFSPKFMINLATLTGAILVALGKQHAGLFSNNDELAGAISKAGIQSAEKVWRLPLAKEYDKMVDSKNADMRNSCGRYAGSITAAQFLQRFVNDVPWAHIDVAGTAMGSPNNEYIKGWASGFGVRLLDQLVRDYCE